MKSPSYIQRFEKFSSARVKAKVKCPVEKGRYCMPMASDPLCIVCMETEEMKDKLDD